MSLQHLERISLWLGRSVSFDGRVFGWEKFGGVLRVGKSTSFSVAQAQRDLLASRIAEARALANYLKALIKLHRQDGSLLERRGISAAGRDTVELTNKQMVRQ